ncbi:MAG: DUF1786 domain-containing protein [Ardenticatenaceae bacterium]|nr:DUF1786 domain-containing protein [Ardenticatenaceae bacterium]
MQILAVDVGTGTQDILLFDTEKEPENAFKLVMPSPTVLVGRRVEAATRAGQRLLLTGVTMGGGPSAWAVERHKKAGLTTFATPDAARTFNDDLEAVQRDLDVIIVGDDEAAALACQEDVAHVAMRDFDIEAIRGAFSAFEVPLDLDPARTLLAVAVFDHGNAPPDVSDRQFRFDYLRERLGSAGYATVEGLAAFAFRRRDIPAIMTRLLAVAATVPAGVELVVMDTAPAAVLGALDDPRVSAPRSTVVVNVGNFHTLAFALAEGRTAGVFEHHTGLINQGQLEGYITRLADGSLTHAELFEHHGHGAIVFHPAPAALDHIAVTGPRRALLRRSPLRPYFAVPHGDMMIAGCFGLVRACAHVFPQQREAIEAALAA